MLCRAILLSETLSTKKRKDENLLAVITEKHEIEAYRASLWGITSLHVIISGLFVLATMSPRQVEVTSAGVCFEWSHWHTQHWKAYRKHFPAAQ